MDFKGKGLKLSAFLRQMRRCKEIRIRSSYPERKNGKFLKGAWILKSGRLARGAVSWLIFHSITSLTFHIFVFQYLNNR
jgi:hypothetical protein